MKAMRGWALLGASLAAVGLSACGDDDDTGPVPDAGSDARSDGRADTSTTPDVRPDTGTADNRDGATTGDGADGGSIPEGGGAEGGDGGSLVQRGEYLVRNVGACGDCHTPINFLTGQRDETRFLAGMPDLFQVPGVGPDGGLGIIGSRNLTPDMTTGLGAWTDAQIKKAFLDGVDKDGNALFPIMPYYVLHNMTPEDADAIVAFLRTIPPIVNMIPPKNFMFPGPAASPPVPANAIPDPVIAMTDPNYASAMRGKYLAGNFGLCMECHTEHVQTPGAVPLNLNKLFAGGDAFEAAEIGLPPSFPVRTIYTENITPHATGIQGWTAAAVAKAIKEGIEKDGLPLCPPMPSGAGRPFGGITDGDALDIGNYVTRLPPINNLIPAICHDIINGDGGASDAGGDADGATPPEGGTEAGPPDATPDTGPDATGDGASDTGGGSDATSDGSSGDAAGDGSTGDGSTGDGSTNDGTTGDGASDANPG